ncbi:NRDE family protein [Jiulongibacter sp. NS-SX5]|uniref:NRDE family protein n=1 Tax=Jiulongibacter sp. NS-SX5 TaxID=3463854 RepID=UPI0040585E82
MCVLTYFPCGNGDFIVGSNRDEAINRESALFPDQLTRHNQEIICPIDPVGGGTWIGTNQNQTLVLLNGGYEKHIPTGNYRQSRGLIIFDFLKKNDPAVFFKTFEFEGMEPFTLVRIDHNAENAITEIRWDEHKGKVFSEIDHTQAQIWSSGTLYDQHARVKRADWYYTHLEKNSLETTEEQLLNFQYEGGKCDPDDSICLDRGLIKTVSISQIVKKDQSVRFKYFDLKNQEDRLVEMI